MESFFSNLFYQHSGNFCEPVTEPMLVSKVTCVLLLVNMAFTGVIACLRFFFFFYATAVGLIQAGLTKLRIMRLFELKGGTEKKHS